MYFVDVKLIEAQLKCFEEHFEIVGELSGESVVTKLAYERCLHILIESFLDVSNGLIDGFIMRDPGSYSDIVDILVDEKVINVESEEIYKQFISLRKPIVQNYWDINFEELRTTYDACKDEVKNFPLLVRAYLKNELGEVVTTFKM